MPLAAIGAIAGIGGSIANGIIGGNAASDAAAAQQPAAQQNEKNLNAASQNALGYQTGQYNTSQQNLQPWLQSGTAAQSALNNLLGLSPQSPSAYGGAPSFSTSGNPASPTQSLNSFSAQQFPGGSTPAPGSPGTFGRPMPGAVGSTSSLNGASASLSSGQPSSTAAPVAGAGASSAPGYGSLLASYPGGAFQAPTALDEQNDPGYQARLALGQTAMEKSAAARGNILTGGTAQAENQAAQDYASNEYNNVYNRALNTYGTNFNVWNTGQNNDYNRLMGLSSAGQNAANEANAAGQSAVNGISSNILGTAQNVAQQGSNAAAANASGIVGQANAYGGMASGIGNSISNLALLQSLNGGGGNPYQTLYNAQNPGFNSISPTYYDPALAGYQIQ